MRARRLPKCSRAACMLEMLRVFTPPTIATHQEVLMPRRARAAGVRRGAVQRFLFRVEIGGVDAGFFKEVSGLTIEQEVIEAREGGQNGAITKLPGVRKFTNIIMKRGFIGDSALYDWLVSLQRKNGRIVMLNARGAEVVAFEFRNGFPAKWTGPELDASKNEVAIETIEIAHEGLTLSN